MDLERQLYHFSSIFRWGYCNVSPETTWCNWLSSCVLDITGHDSMDGSRGKRHAPLSSPVPLRMRAAAIVQFAGDASPSPISLSLSFGRQFHGSACHSRRVIHAVRAIWSVYLQADEVASRQFIVLLKIYGASGWQVWAAVPPSLAECA